MPIASYWQWIVPFTEVSAPHVHDGDCTHWKLAIAASWRFDVGCLRSSAYGFQWLPGLLGRSSRVGRHRGRRNGLRTRNGANGG